MQKYNAVKIISTFVYHKKVEFLDVTKKGAAKATPKIERICILRIYKEYFLCLQSIASVSFLQKCISFVEQRLKFSQFEGGIIP